jgi:hypothetical protein
LPVRQSGAQTAAETYDRYIPGENKKRTCSREQTVHILSL